MRDDIHNKAPISRSLKRLLRHALLPADQLRPSLLESIAVSALHSDAILQLTPTLAEALRMEAESPLLFPRVVSDPGANTRLQSDVIAHLKLGATSVKDAMASALNGYIQSLSNESEAAMIAAGGSRRVIREGVEAFRNALEAAAPKVVERYLGATALAVPSHKVSLKELLPLGRRAREPEGAS